MEKAQKVPIAVSGLPVPLERDVFLRSLLRELAGTLQDVVGLEEASGFVSVVGYVAVDDVGNILNDTIVVGQIHGGVAQGLGQVLGEQVIYGDDGQLLTASFMDYVMPRADDMPTMTVLHHAVPCTTNPIGVKGAGESGVAGSLPSGVSAVLDALSTRGITHLDLPMTSERVWKALQGR